MITICHLTRLFRSVRSVTLKTQKMVSTYVWIDLEMTGLDIERDHILEIACILTKPDLQPLHEGITFVIHQPDNILDSMNNWCKEQHGKTGLTEACKNSKISLSEAEDEVAKYITTHVKGGHKYLAGNSVYMDRLFLMKYMPKVSGLLHYRILDISSIKLLCNDWYRGVSLAASKKKLNHRALDDILESISELKFYRENIFIKDEEQNAQGGAAQSCSSKS